MGGTRTDYKTKKIAFIKFPVGLLMPCIGNQKGYSSKK
jgi:hypothetical protein